MTEPFLSINGMTHPCYTFYQRALQCMRREDDPLRMCFVEGEDYIECKTRKRHRAFQNFVGDELNKLRVYSLPTYDPETDTFKDGPLPRDADAYFNKPIDQQNYYSDA